jgi:hypothetical protein
MTHRAGPIARCATSLLAVIALIGLVPLALLAVTDSARPILWPSFLGPGNGALVMRPTSRGVR